MALNAITRRQAQHAVTRLAPILAMALAFGAVGTARAGTAINRTLKLAPGGRFVLQTFAGTVSVMGSSRSGADISITSARDNIQRDVNFEFQEGPGEVNVKATRRDPWNFSWGFGGYRLHFDVRVPKNTQVLIMTGGGGIRAFQLDGDTTLQSSGGPIEAVQLGGNLRANTSGGTIHANEIHGEADLNTSGGGISAQAIDGPLRAYTSGGWIRIRGVGGRIEARTSGGSIEAAFDKGNSQGGDLSTSGGSIRVNLDPAANLNIDASTSGGTVRASLPLRTPNGDWNGAGWRNDKRHLRGTLGKGGATLRMRSGGGSIQISPL